MKKNNLLKKRFFSIILTIAVALSMMLTICTTLLNLDGSQEALEKKEQLWRDIVQAHPELKGRLRAFSLAAVSNLPGTAGRKMEITGYRMANKIFKFN